MLKKLFSIFRRSTPDSIKGERQRPDPGPQHATSADQTHSHPLAGARVGGKELTRRMLSAMKAARGVHIESLLCALASVAGYSCQAALRAQATSRGLPEESLLVVVSATDGKKYFFGDHLNRLLAESQYSVWSVSGGGAQAAGCVTLPDLSEIFKHNSSAVGTEQFGKPRVPAHHMPHEPPIAYVRSLWPRLEPFVRTFCPNPEHWPILLSLSIQEVIVMGKSLLDPCLALQLVMESAIPMSSSI